MRCLKDLCVFETFSLSKHARYSLSDSSLCMVFNSTYFLSVIGLAGNNDLDDAILGGVSDYICDIASNLGKIWSAKDNEKVT